MTRTARELAADILNRVEEDKSYVNLLLTAKLGQLDNPPDRRLTTSLVNGVIKHRLTLEYALRQHMRTGLSALPREIRQILRLGAFQLLFMDRIPAAVSVHESVEQAKKAQGKYAGLVNGVLRHVGDRGWDLPWPDQRREPVRYLSVRYSHPEWLVTRWYRRWGLAETEALCRLNNEPAPAWIRTNTLKISRPELLVRLREEGVTAEPGERTPESLVIRDYGSIDQLPGFRAGLFTVQDESSQLAAHLVAPQAGDYVLDACSAPGGKTTHLAQLMGNLGHITAYDVHPHKLELIEDLAARLGITIIETRTGDARELPGLAPGTQDRVLVDAPCSGLGVLRRKADARWRKEERDITELPKLQLAILGRAAAMVRPGGVLVYSTCTIEPEENFEVLKAFRAGHPEFKPVDISEGLPFRLEDERDSRQAQKGMLQLLPQRHGTDGFFLAELRRVGV